VLDAYRRIEAAVHGIAQSGTVPLTMGGDGAVTLPQLRALRRVHPSLVVLHIDAHTDTYPNNPEMTFGGPADLYNTATAFVRAAEEQLIDTANSFHVGIRGFTVVPDNIPYTQSLGYRVITGRELFDQGIGAVAALLRRELAGRPVYLCFDMDFFDPSCAPGVASPSRGGASAREGLALLEGLAGLDIVAVDVNTVSPPHDCNGMTAHLAGVVMLHCLHLVLRREPGVRRGNG
jgi:agmatinase